VARVSGTLCGRQMRSFGWQAMPMSEHTVLPSLAVHARQTFATLLQTCGVASASATIISMLRFPSDKTFDLRKTNVLRQTRNSGLSYTRFRA
jgi:hypothetical protein